MKRNVLLDTGPLVALLDRRDHYHPWAKARFAEVEPPLLTCEAVLTEAVHLLRHLPTGARAVLDLLRLGVLSTPFSVAQESHRLGQLLESYADVPMAFADGCLVRLAELHPGSEILTIDSDFKDLPHTWPAGDPDDTATRNRLRSAARGSEIVGSRTRQHDKEQPPDRAPR